MHGKKQEYFKGISATLQKCGSQNNQGSIPERRLLTDIFIYFLTNKEKPSLF